MGQIHTEVHRCVTFGQQVKYRVEEFDVFDSFTFDNFKTIDFLDWVHLIEVAMKENPDWEYEFEAGGGHDDMSCYLMVHRFKETTEAHWKTYTANREKKLKDIRRQEYLRLKKEFENEMD